MARVASASSAIPYPSGWLPACITPPIAQVPIPRALTTMPLRPSVLVIVAVMRSLRYARRSGGQEQPAAWSALQVKMLVLVLVLVLPRCGQSVARGPAPRGRR